MRIIWTIILIIALLSASTMFVQAEFRDNFVIHYNFDKDKGEVIKDLSGKGNDGKIVNDVKIVKGEFGQCAEFPGGTSHIETIIDVPEFNFTMALWIKTDAQSQGVYSVLDGAAGAGGHDRHFYIQGGNICFRVWQGGGWCTGTKVADGKWHHIALVTESKVGQIAYVDGKEAGKNAYDHSDFNWQKRVWVGFSNDAAPNYFTGLIDEVAYLDKPLEADEIKALMKPSGMAVNISDKLPTVWGAVKYEY